MTLREALERAAKAMQARDAAQAELNAALKSLQDALAAAAVPAPPVEDAAT